MPCTIWPGPPDIFLSLLPLGLTVLCMLGKDAWTAENGLVGCDQKPRRAAITALYREHLDACLEGEGPWQIIRKMDPAEVGCGSGDRSGAHVSPHSQRAAADRRAYPYPLRHDALPHREQPAQPDGQGL